jgi:hypothetical protein
MIATLLMAAAATAGQACTFDPEEGSLASAAEARPEHEARNDPEFSGDSFSHDGATYRKSGPPRKMAPSELQAFDMISDVPLFTAPGEYEAKVSYLMVSSAGCVFQSYDKDSRAGG